MRSIACAIFIFFTLFALPPPPPFKKFRKNICCEGYSKACLCIIWLWSLLNITSKKKFRKIQQTFSATIKKKKISLFCEIASLVYTTYMFLIKISRAVFKINHFLNFCFPLNSSFFLTDNFFKLLISINNGVITNKYSYYSCRTVGLLHKMSLKG